MVLLSGLLSVVTQPQALYNTFIKRVSPSLLFQPMMMSMRALSVVIQKASANNSVGSAVLNLLQNQVRKTLMLKGIFFFTTVQLDYFVFVCLDFVFAYLEYATQLGQSDGW